MSEYAITVFSITAICGVLSLVAYGSGRAESLALGIITLFILASPILGAVADIDPDDLIGEIEIPDDEIGSSFSQALEKAYSDGVRSLVAEKFSLNREDIRVKTVGFDTESVSAEKTRVILSGRAALADYRGIEKYLNEALEGEIRVEIEIG